MAGLLDFDLSYGMGFERFSFDASRLGLSTHTFWKVDGINSVWEGDTCSGKIMGFLAGR